MAAEEGIWGFYRGFGAVLVGSIPGSVAYYGAFEAAKLVLPPGSGVAGGLATGAAAQLVAGAIFTPMDVIKERMQVASLPPLLAPAGTRLTKLPDRHAGNVSHRRVPERN